ncbi:MAG: HAD-IC family P-type ATPase, partial [Synergistes sp.]|nr:HAD-IC family P-type ATPase [Synergistes sp.]
IIKLSRQNALVKKMIASETVGCVNVICSDKTGTLTENKMKVRAFFDGTFRTECGELSDSYLSKNICINATADLGEKGEFIGNPTECALLTFYEGSNARSASKKSYKEERESYNVVQKFPFSSDLKHMTTIAEIGGTPTALTKGSPEAVIAMCRIGDDEKKEAEEKIVSVQRQAMRVIGFAHKELAEEADFGEENAHKDMESEMHFDGFTAIADPLRSEVYDAVKTCREAGIELKILTGDNIVTAKAIAEELGILKGDKIAVEAREVADMSDEELSENIDRICVIARSTPSIKMRVVKLLKAKGNVVAVTGDGINDAPALKSADVGIAMGISGTEVSKEAGDIVLLDDSFATIVKAVEWGRNIYENFKRFISFQLTVNYASVVVVFTSILLGLKAPFTALQLLWINIIMDGPPALTLGLEPNHGDLMKRSPTKRNENIIT